MFRGGWIALLFDHQLPDPGDQMPVEAAGLPLVAVRDRAGDVRVFHNVCRHRASLVVPTPVRGQPTMRSPYHGWAYGLDGTLRATPLWDGQRVTSPEALDRSRLGLREVRCGVWSGVVWIDLSGTAPPLAEHVAPLTALWREIAASAGIARRPSHAYGRRRQSAQNRPSALAYSEGRSC